MARIGTTLTFHIFISLESNSQKWIFHYLRKIFTVEARGGALG
jgi:hypothetical protein